LEDAKGDANRGRSDKFKPLGLGEIQAGGDMIQTAKLNDVDPQAWLADVLGRIADHKINDLAALLLWNWQTERIERAA